uniref:CSON000645 protein n=1 Tax=Culicoides sonorensis TaxID=179676 RepID=A0A336LU09_CULSO
MFSMHRTLGRNLAYVLFQRKSHSQVASMAARAVSDKKPSEIKTSITDTVDLANSPKKNSLVAAAFAALKEEDVTSVSTTSNKKGPPKSSLIDEMIINAKTVTGLLSIGDDETITRKHALKIVSILSEWSSINKVKISDFESDPRFIKLCRILGRTVTKNGSNSPKRNEAYRTDDLNVVLGVTGEDEAAKLIANITIPQMIKVMSSLALKKRRSMTLLRAIAYNISGSSSQLDLKQASDLLYAMAVLNFPDPVLVDRICSDVQQILPKNTEKSAVVGSILTSLGLLRYRDTAGLESMTDWMLKNQSKCRPQDIAALFHTLAILNYPSCHVDQLKEKMIENLQEQDLPKALDWLNYVWSLVLLDVSSEKHLESVLRREFLEKLVIERKGVLSPNMKMKLLNINGYATFKNYKGSLLSQDSTIFDVPLAHNKDKQKLVIGMLESLKSLVSLESYVKTNVNTKMGFVIDAECCFDSKGSPISFDKADSSCKRIAIMVHDYHDMCQGIHSSLTGVANCSIELLKKSGYIVLSIPYTEFSVSDKLLKRVQYLESKIKAITKPKGKTT